MTVVSYRSIAQIIGMVGILAATAAGLTLPQPPENSEHLIAYAVDSGLTSLDAVAGTFVQAEAIQEDPGGTHPVSEDGPAPPAARVAVLGHYPGYAAYLMPVESIRYDKLTHISYFSLWPLANGNLDVSEVNVPDLEKLVESADANGVKALVTVGGWERSRYFSTLAASPRTRANFATNLLLYCLGHNLTGADLDWEPVWTKTDMTNYSLLVERVHEEFEPFGLLLSVSVSAFGQEIKPEAIDLIDSLNVMAYDGTPPHHSTFEFAVSALHHWEDYGVPREKLMLGVPFYGTSEDGTGYAYSDIFNMYHPSPNEDFVSGIGFNGVNTIKEKTAYVVNNGYRGIMIWEISQDTSGRGSLLNAITDTIANFPSAIPDVNMPPDVNEFQVVGSTHEVVPAKTTGISCVSSGPPGGFNDISHEVFSAEMVGFASLVGQKRMPSADNISVLSIGAKR